MGFEAVYEGMLLLSVMQCFKKKNERLPAISDGSFQMGSDRLHLNIKAD